VLTCLTVKTDGSFTGTGYSPPVEQFSHFASQGANIFRVPFAWQLMTPTLGGTVSSSFLSKYDATVNAALATGAYVILDLHSKFFFPVQMFTRAQMFRPTDYARWNGAIIGQGGPTNAQYASIWSQLAAHYKGNSKIIFGIMNEPHDVPNLQSWATSVQAAVTAIRQAGATSQYILIPGSSYSSAQALPNEAGPYLLKVTDSDGSTKKLIFDVHKYLDSDNSGTHTECVTDNVGVFQTLYSWLQTNGRQALLSETVSDNAITEGW
jgi:endoglucanase